MSRECIPRNGHVAEASGRKDQGRYMETKRRRLAHNSKPAWPGCMSSTRHTTPPTHACTAACWRGQPPYTHPATSRLTASWTGSTDTLPYFTGTRTSISLHGKAWQLDQHPAFPRQPPAHQLPGKLCGQRRVLTCAEEHALGMQDGPSAF